MARLEIIKSRSVVDRRIVFFMMLVVLVLALAVPHMDITTFSMTRSLYLVKVDGPPFEMITASDNRFRLVEEAPLDLEINGSRIEGEGKQRSLAALSALDESVRNYYDNLLKRQYSQEDPEYYSAFPVWTDIKYLDSSLTIVPKETEIAPVQTPALIEGNISTTRIPEIIPGPVENITGTPPGEIRPPFPLMSVLVSFVFVVPMFFITQLYSSSIMDERMSRKGIMLLVSPLRGYEIVVGKTLPFFVIMLLFVGIASALLGGGLFAVLIMVPVMLIFLSTAFVSSILARNFRELTMMLIFFAIVLGSYLFIPTAFVNIHEYSIISPLTLVVTQLEGEAVSFEGMVFASAPLLFVSLLSFLFGTLLVNEEGLLLKVEIFDKIIESVERLLYYLGDRRLGVLIIGMLMVPFVFLNQLFLLVIFFNIMKISPVLVIGISIAVSVFIEEWAKVLAPLVLFNKGHRGSVFIGILSGTGYFLGEKGLLLLVLTSVVKGGLGEVLFVGAGYLLVIPLTIHVAGAVISIKGIAHGISPKMAVFMASALHFLMNLVIILRGGMLG